MSLNLNVGLLSLLFLSGFQDPESGLIGVPGLFVWGRKSGVPLLTLLYPEEGAEVMSEGGIPVMVRRILDPDVRGQLRVVIQRNAEL